MKKIVCACICMGIAGCSPAIGSFQEGSIHMEVLYKAIMEQKEESNWRYEQLEDGFWKDQEIEKKYHLDMTKVEEAYVKSSPILTDMSEIAFFKITKGQESIVKEAIAYRLNNLLQTWEPYKKDTTILIDDARQGKIGRYYYFILGEDSKKVVNYIRNLE